ncbi:MAG TPA: proton-conducting transporter membrane subunit [Candidatus Bathyarchaeia archaeon]|nr:proton-conducting transporter membrane subunit [Candidatus Bathyarchaeia archaeon]
MLIPYVLLQVVVVPIVVAIICVLFGRRLGKNLGYVATAALAYTTLLLTFVCAQFWSQRVPIFEEYHWSTAVFSLQFGFLADGLSLPVALVMNLICTVMACYSVNYMEHRVEQIYGKEKTEMYPIYYSLFLLFPAGLVGIALSTNLIELYLFVESGLIPFYILMDLFGYADRHRIAMMSFIWTQVGAAIFLIGAVVASTGTGSFNISALSTISGTSLGFLVCFLMLVGWLVKMATFGFHVWLPYVHTEHPTSIAPILATMVGVGNYVLARLLVGYLFLSFQIFSVPLMILAVVTMIYGALLTIAQDDVKRLFACSTIGQTSYSLLGIASLTQMGVAGGVFYFVSHIIGKCILFSVAGILVTQTGVRSIKEMGGLAQRMPFTAMLCILGSMVLSAIPPLSGFQAEWIMFVGIFTKGVTGSTPYLIIGIIAIFATFLTSVYTFWPAIRIFFGPLAPNMEKVKEAPLSMTLPLFVLAIVSLLIGIFPNLILRFLQSVI